MKCDTPILDAAVNFNTAAAQTVIACPARPAVLPMTVPPPGYRIRILGLYLSASGIVNLTLRSGANAKSGAIAAVAQYGVVLPVNENGWLDCNAGEDFVIVSDAAVQVSGIVRYTVGDF